MKRLLLLFSIVVFVVCTLYPEVVKNPDKSLMGEWDFKCEKVWQTEGYNDELLAQVQQFYVHDNGDIYLFDRKHSKFFVFDKTGKPKLSFGKNGEGPGEIKTMLSFFLLEDKVIVSDLGKIHYFGLDGKYIKSIPTGSMAINIAPKLFIDDNRLVKIRPGLRVFNRKEALEINNLIANTTIYLAGEPVPNDRKSVNMGNAVFTSVGANVASEERPGFAVGKASDKLYWGKNDAYLIRACDFAGKELFSFSIEGRKSKKITQEYKEQKVARLKRVYGANFERRKNRILSRMPDESTYFCHIVPAANGLIYVYVSDVMRKNGREIDIFSAQGKYLYHADITFPEGSRFLANGLVFKGDFLYAVVEEESGDFNFSKYSIRNPKNK